jgi:hypothetical protein
MKVYDYQGRVLQEPVNSRWRVGRDLGERVCKSNGAAWIFHRYSMDIPILRELIGICMAVQGRKQLSNYVWRG